MWQGLLVIRITPADRLKQRLHHERVFNVWLSGLIPIDEDCEVKGSCPAGRQTTISMFETMRAHIDKTHFFPVSTFADDAWNFPDSTSECG